MQYQCHTIRNTALMIIALMGLSACAQQQPSRVDAQWQEDSYATTPYATPYNATIGPSNSIF